MMKIENALMATGIIMSAMSLSIINPPLTLGLGATSILIGIAIRINRIVRKGE